MGYFECVMARATLVAPCFFIHENVLKKRCVKDLRKRKLSEDITAGNSLFKSGNVFSHKYADKEEHMIRNDIVIARRSL